MDIEVVVLCVEANKTLLKNTINSVLHHGYNRNCLAIVPKKTTKEEINELNQICPAYRGRNTITSLINCGINKIKSSWAIFAFAGSRFPYKFEEKINSLPVEEHDIFYPALKDRYDFVTASFNGVIINKKFFKQVGKFPEQADPAAGMTDFEIAKLIWAAKAIEKGGQFKGIVGLKII